MGFLFSFCYVHTFFSFIFAGEFVGILFETEKKKDERKEEENNGKYERFRERKVENTQSSSTFGVNFCEFSRAVSGECGFLTASFECFFTFPKVED